MSTLERENASDYLEGLMEGFVAYDGEWRMTYMNAAAERILGRRRDEVLGKTWHQAFPHAVGNPVDHMYQRVIGLSLARTLVELHGGTIRAMSEGEGKGAEFVVSLPALAPLAPQEQPGR